MKCKNCGADNPRKAVHCKNCGEALNFTEPENKSELVENKNEKLEEIQKRRDEKKHKMRRNKIILISLIAIICVGGLSYGAYWLNENLFNRTSVDDISLPSAQPTESVVPSEPVPEESALPSREPTATLETVVPSEGTAEGWTTATESPKSTVAPAKTNAPANNSSSTATNKPSSTKKPTATKKPVSTKKPSATLAPVVEVPMGSPMSSQLIKGEGLVSDGATGNSYLKFTIGSTVYYGYNPIGAINNGVYSNYNVHGYATSLTYDGLPVYELYDVSPIQQSGNNAVSNDYVIAKSSSTILTEADLAGLSKAQLEIARNEIYARHGRTFKKASLQSYFSAKSWYKVNKNYNYSNDALNLTKTEQANAKFILAHEK